MSSKKPRSSSGWFLPVSIVALAVAGSVVMTKLSPPPQSKAMPDKAMLVSAMQVEKENLTINVPSQGRVAPHTRTNLISEVSGIVIEVADEFVGGGFVKKGQLLIKLDDRNYRSAVKQAEANVARAHKDLIQEKGQAQVAYQQYKNTRSTKRSPEALSLLLREPQLRESEANLAFAKAELERVKGDLENTEVRAPYDGLIKKKHIDIGQYASLGSAIAEIIAIDYAEVRLAVPQDRLAYLDLPMIAPEAATPLPTVAPQAEDAANTDASDTLADTNTVMAEPQAEQAPTSFLPDESQWVPVTLKSVYGDVEYQWPAKIVRTEGFFDESSHTLYAVARIEDPYLLKASSRDQRPSLVPLLMGTYVEADIEGHKLEDMVKIPRYLLRAGDNVWVIDENNQLRNRKLEILRTGGEDVYVLKGLQQGERLCLTNVGEVVPGTTVRVASDEERPSQTETAMLYE